MKILRLDGNNLFSVAIENFLSLSLHFAHIYCQVRIGPRKKISWFGYSDGNLQGKKEKICYYENLTNEFCITFFLGKKIKGGGIKDDSIGCTPIDSHEAIESFELHSFFFRAKNVTIACQENTGIFLLFYLISGLLLKKS